MTGCPDLALDAMVLEEIRPPETGGLCQVWFRVGAEGRRERAGGFERTIGSALAGAAAAELLRVATMVASSRDDAARAHRSGTGRVPQISRLLKTRVLSGSEDAEKTGSQ